VVYLAALLKPFKSDRGIFWVTLAGALLFQFELAVAPLYLLIGLYYWHYRKKINSQKAFIGWGTLGLVLGLLPQLLFDLTNRFQQLGGFGLWVIYRLAAFTGMVPGRASGLPNLADAGERFYLYGSRFISWGRPGLIWLAVILVGYGVYLTLTKYRQSFCLMILASWLGLLAIGFMIHGGPSEAYFPALFVPTVLMIGFVGSSLKMKAAKSLILIVVGLAVYNSWYILKNDFLLSTPQSASVNSPYGAPYWVYESVVDNVIQRAQGEPVQLRAIGPGTEFPTYLDSLRFIFSLHHYPLDDEKGYPVWVISGSGDERPTVPNTKQLNFEGMIISIPI
jgi:hypothetical protein